MCYFVSFREQVVGWFGSVRFRLFCSFFLLSFLLSFFLSFFLLLRLSYGLHVSTLGVKS